jgi:Rrf2 family protein
MKLSTRSTYGMRALVELALTAGRGPLSATLIAKRQDLSVAYLEQLLHRLKRQGLVSSIRGPRGGYVLARDPHQITMADVVRVLDGKNGRSRAGSPRASPMASGARRHAQRIADTVWRCVHERLAQSLGTVTLQDLCEEVRTDAGEPLDHRYVFHI